MSSRRGPEDPFTIAVEPSPSGAVPPRLRITLKEGVEAGAGEIVCRLTDRNSPLVRIPYEIISQKQGQARYERELAAKVRLSTDEVNLGRIKPNRTWTGQFTVTAARCRSTWAPRGTVACEANV